MDALTYAPLTEQVARVRRREVSSRELVDAHLARIQAVNPQLNAVVELCAEDARAAADRADRALAASDATGPLHGVPFTLKDSFDTAGVVSTWGTPGRRGAVPGRDATVAARLRAAGAILIGKTNTPEFTLSFHTDNPVYGPTHNPYDVSRSPGGSSGGAAAIVAAGGAPFDLGTDTGGSIRLPAHFCGVAGLRPTSGRVPRTGHAIGPGGPLQALTQVGPIARRVADLGLVLPVIAGPDGCDPAIAPVPLGDPADVDLSALRVAFYTDSGRCTPTPEVSGAVRDAARTLADAGAKLDEARPPGVEDTLELFMAVMAFDGGAWLRALLRSAGTPLSDTSLALAGMQGLDITGESVARVFERWDAYRDAMSEFLTGYDLIVCPPNARPAVPPEDVEGEAFAYTMPYNLTGWPGAVVRAGTSLEGLPIGVQLIAGPWREEVALAAAAHVEHALGGWQPPTL